VLDKITDRTKAIVVVNLGGIRVPQVVFSRAKECGIPVVVDACQSLGIPEPNGDLVAYSFQAIKHITAGDLGVLVCRTPEHYSRAKKLRWFGIDREAKKRAGWQCVVNHQMAMDIEEPGYKFQPTDIDASLGLVGLRHSDEILAIRKHLAYLYILNLPGVRCVAGGSYWAFGILIENRDTVAEQLRANGIECDPVHLRNDIFTVFKQFKSDKPLCNMDWVERRYLYLPFHLNLTTEDVLFVCKTLKELLT
jgi:dTDP-4-amino-4,6-dideoxygalactose transaminase